MSRAKSSPCTIFQLLRLRDGALRENHSLCDWNSTKEVLLWHFAVLEIRWDLICFCLNICAAIPGSENTQCVNGLTERGKRPKNCGLLHPPLQTKVVLAEGTWKVTESLCLSFCAALLMWIVCKGKTLGKYVREWAEEHKGAEDLPSDMIPCSWQYTTPTSCWDKILPPLKHLSVCVIQKRKLLLAERKTWVEGFWKCRRYQAILAELQDTRWEQHHKGEGKHSERGGNLLFHRQ